MDHPHTVQRARRTGLRLFLGRAALAVAASFLAVALAALATQRWFFDRLYYQKSVAHGYWEGVLGGGNPDAVGGRARYLPALYRALGRLPPSWQQYAERPPEPIPEGSFVAVVLGDSLCWGQGVRDHQRWVHRLEQRLDRVRPTVLIPLCEPGDQLIDHWNKHGASQAVWQPDLYIFALVSDDVLLSGREVTLSPPAREIVEGCAQHPSSDGGGPMQQVSMDFAYSPGSAQRCVADAVLARLPQERSLYFIYGPPFHMGVDVAGELARPLEQRGIEVLELVPDQGEGPDGPYSRRYYVSKREVHPSAWSHKLFAEALYEHIVADPELGFARP